MEDAILDEIRLLDGSLIDMYLLDTTFDDWDRFIRFVQTYTTYAFYILGEPAPLSRTGREIIDSFHDEGLSALLTIFPGLLNLNCHFFWEGEIELDLVKRDFHAADSGEIDVLKLTKLRSFLEELATELGKVVIVTPESCQGHPICRYDPAVCRWTH